MWVKIWNGPSQTGWGVGRVRARLSAWGRHFGQRKHRIAIVIMLLWGSLNALVNVLTLVAVAIAPSLHDVSVIALLVTDNEARSVADVPWLVVRLTLESAAGLATAAAVVLLFLGREQRAITLAVFAVTLWLTTVALLTFYLDQFGAMYGALLQFASLMILLTYQRWYLEELPSAAATAPGSATQG